MQDLLKNLSRDLVNVAAGIMNKTNAPEVVVDSTELEEANKVNKAKLDAASANRNQSLFQRDNQHDKSKAEMKHTFKRFRGVDKAVDKLTKEDTDLQEQADALYEISKKTLSSYTSKAEDSVAGRGRKSAKKLQRVSNIDLAKEKLSKILEKEHLAKEKKHAAKVDVVHNHFQKESKSLLAKHGYSKVHSAGDRAVYHKGHDNGHSTMIRINENPNKHPHDSHGSKYSVHSTDGSGTIMGHNHTVNHRDDVETNKTEAVHKFHSNLIGHDKMGKQPSLYESVDVLEEGRRGRPPKDAAKRAAFNSAETDEPKMHIIAQLNKVKDSSVSTHVQFKDGSKHEVHSRHAEQILAKYSGMKPNEKIAFQQKVASSHASFKSEL